MTTEAATPPLATPRRRFSTPQIGVLVAVVVLFLAGLGYLVYDRMLSRPVTPATTGTPVPVRRGNVAATVAATGSVVSTRQSKLTMQTAGRLKEIPVKLGDEVKTGAVLAKLDTGPLELKVAQAQSTLRVNQIKLDQLKAGARPEEIAAAEAAVRSAQAKLTELQGGAAAQDLVQAQAAVEAAAANIRSSQGKLGDVAAGSTAQDLVQAQAALEGAASSVRSAQAKLEQLRAGASASDVAAAEQAVAQAQSNLQKAETDLARVKAGATPEELAAAELALEQAKNSLWAQQISRDGACGRGVDTPACQSANAQVAASETNVTSARVKIEALKLKPDPRDVQNAEAVTQSARESLRSAQARLDQLKAGPTVQEVTQAQAALDSALANQRSAAGKLEALRAGARPGDLQAAQSSVESAQANYQSAVAKLEALQAGPKSAEVAAAQSALIQAQAQLAAKRGATPQEIALAEEQVKQAEISLKQAQIDLENAALTAPYDGVVGAVTANVGEQVGSGAAILTLVDPKAARVDVSVDETDIAKIQPGKPALITFDALPDRRFNGKVVGIAPNATVQQGVATYGVSISIDDAGDTLLPAGLTANVSVVVAQRENVLLVPNRALRTVGRNRVVEVLVGDKPETRQVKTGLGNEQFTEVTEGVAENEQVLIQATTTQAPRVGGFGPAGGGPPPGAQPQFVVKPGPAPAKPAGGGG